MSEADKIIESLKNSGKKVEEFYVSNKTSDKNVGSIEEDIRILQEKDCMWHYPETRIEEAIENIIADYTRQKEMNEEHQKINGELRQAINTVEKEKSDWIKAYQKEKDSQFELLKRIKELEEERNHWHGCFIVAMENSIPMQVVIDKMEELRNDIKLGNCRYPYIVRHKIEVLQELLGKEN